MMRKLNHRNGFSLVELTVVTVLMALMALMLSSAWVGVGRNAAELIGRSRLVQERDLAVVALSRDLGGCFVNADAQKGEQVDGRWLDWVLPNAHELDLYYDGGTNASGDVLANTVVRYVVEPDPILADPPNPGILKRKTSISGGTETDFVVARNVFSMDVSETAGTVTIVLCFKYRTLTLTCDLTAKQPSVPSATATSWSTNDYTNP